MEKNQYTKGNMVLIAESIDFNTPKPHVNLQLKILFNEKLMSDDFDQQIWTGII